VTNVTSRVLVLGAYGLIGLEIVRRLRASGHDVVGLGRSIATGRRLAPEIDWIGADLASLTTPEAWRRHLHGIAAVVNASGALQDGARDNLAASQSLAIRTLIAACEEVGVTRFIQISAPSADPAARSAFLRTKGEADAVLRGSTLDWLILKPGLVIGANAYGGTALLRMLAAFPVVQPLVLGDSLVQTVAADDVAEAVAMALAGTVPMRSDYDLMEDTPQTLRNIVRRFRRWLGFAEARATLDLPPWIGFTTARIADTAGWFGWRSPLRSTALSVLSHGVTGDPGPWRRATGHTCRSLRDTLAALPNTAQERVFARARLVFPVLLVVLSIFWIASGVIGIVQREAAATLLDGVLSTPAANILILAGDAIDIAIGVGLIVRSWTRHAAVAAIIVSFGYLLAGTVLIPWLWADPIGPFVKVLPGIALALAVAALMEER